MNFLQLCQRVTREAGIRLSGPDNTTGNSGTQFQRVADWTNDAYRDIQSMNEDWNFMRRSFSLTTTASDGDYTAAQVYGANPRIASYLKRTLRCYLQSTGVSDEQPLYWLEYQSFMDTYRMGAARTTEGRPQRFTVAPDRGLLLAPIPDAAYVVTGDYVRTLHDMEADADEPIFDADYHMAIVWWAVMKHAGFEEASSQYIHAQNQLRGLRARMERQERPETMVIGTLA